MDKISQINKKDFNLHPFICGAIYSRIIFSKCKKYFLIAAIFSKSKKTILNPDDFEWEYINTLNRICFSHKYLNNKWISLSELKGLHPNVEWETKIANIKACLVIKNDLYLSKERILWEIHQYITKQPYLMSDTLNDEKKWFIRGFWELRSSIDVTTNYLSQDYFYKTSWEATRALILIQFMNVPEKKLNFNFREVQNQYINQNKKRNAQLRINLSWYTHNIGLINSYKKSIITSSEHNLVLRKWNENDINYLTLNKDIRRYSASFISRLIFYLDNVFQKDLSENDINSIRKELNFENENNINQIRDKKIVDLCRIILINKCFGCNDTYKLESRTFIHKKTNKPYLEIHHVIPFSRGKEFDVIDNLVKLCPVCHKSLTKGIMDEEKQKILIKKILTNSPKALDFIKMVFPSNKEEISYWADVVFNNINE